MAERQRLVAIVAFPRWLRIAVWILRRTKRLTGLPTDRQAEAIGRRIAKAISPRIRLEAIERARQGPAKKIGVDRAS